MFNANGASEPGVNMAALAGLAGGSEVIPHPITLWIKWAGYEHVTWNGIRVSGGNMTRAEIAQRVARSFSDFINLAQGAQIDPNYTAFRAGRAGITLDKLVLVSLACMVGELWVAEVEVDRA
ncbi:hypothetical protein HWV62_13355 [Athelia sp. TMB]|nr:hypothetical protein HWV62_13355 [Athelia sp. TMB]